MAHILPFESLLILEKTTITIKAITVLMFKVIIVENYAKYIALVDFKKRFIDIEVGWPGSVADARVFEASYLARNYEEYL